MNISAISKRMMLVISLSSIVLLIAAIAYYRSMAFVPFALGLLIGSGFNVWKVIALENTLQKAVLQQKSANYIQIHVFIRFILTGLLLVLSAVVPFISLYGCAAGIMTYQIAAFSIKSFENRDESTIKRRGFFGF